MKFEDMTEDQQAKAALAYFKSQNKKVEHEDNEELIKKPKVEENSAAQIEYNKRRKTVNLQLLYVIFLGWAPVYLNAMGFKKIAFARFALLMTSIFLTPINGIDIGMYCLVIACAWWFSDVFLIQLYVSSYNKNLAKQLGLTSSPP